MLYIAIGLAVFAAFTGIVELRRRKRKPPADEAEILPRAFVARRPHSCPSGRPFMPIARTRAMKVGEEKPVDVMMTDSSGRSVMTSLPAEVGVVVCDGVFCGFCGRRLECACGGTPVEATVLESEEERLAILSCCGNPFWLDSGVPDMESLPFAGWNGKGIPRA